VTVVWGAGSSPRGYEHVTNEPLDPVVQAALPPSQAHWHQTFPEQVGIVWHVTEPAFTWQYSVLSEQNVVPHAKVPGGAAPSGPGVRPPSFAVAGASAPAASPDVAASDSFTSAMFARHPGA
jgi:hypothetical protein